jgi:hypothetical protein
MSPSQHLAAQPSEPIREALLASIRTTFDVLPDDEVEAECRVGEAWVDRRLEDGRWCYSWHHGRC